MKFEDLRQRMKSRLFFRLEDLRPSGVVRAHEPVQISQWVRAGKLYRLKKGVYTLGSDDRQTESSALTIAEALYRPSYLSLEWALSHYGLIPEAAGSMTSVSTLKTAQFTNFLGTFIYRHVQPRYFFGYSIQRALTASPASYALATREKALMDFIYLVIPPAQALSADLFLKGYRLQNLESLRKARFHEYLRRFDDPRVQRGTRELLRLL